VITCDNIVTLPKAILAQDAVGQLGWQSEPLSIKRRYALDIEDRSRADDDTNPAIEGTPIDHWCNAGPVEDASPISLHLLPRCLLRRRDVVSAHKEAEWWRDGSPRVPWR